MTYKNSIFDSGKGMLLLSLLIILAVILFADLAGRL